MSSETNEFERPNKEQKLEKKYRIWALKHSPAFGLAMASGFLPE
jgi:hypothetical protein